MRSEDSGGGAATAPRSVQGGLALHPAHDCSSQAIPFWILHHLENNELICHFNLFMLKENMPPYRREERGNVSDWDKMATAFRPQYHNKAMSDLFTHFVEDGIHGGIQLLFLNCSAKREKNDLLLCLFFSFSSGEMGFIYL